MSQSTKRVYRLKRLSGVFIAILLLILSVASPALATVYECQTKQVLQWKHGKLMPDKNRFSRTHEILNFDDQTGILQIALNANSQSSAMQLNILQPSSLGNDLYALASDKNDIGTTFTLRNWDTEAGSIFLFYSRSLAAISTGTCHTME